MIPLQKQFSLSFAQNTKSFKEYLPAGHSTQLSTSFSRCKTSPDSHISQRPGPFKYVPLGQAVAQLATDVAPLAVNGACELHFVHMTLAEEAYLPEGHS